MLGHLEFSGPMWEAMKNMGPFGSFLELVGAVESDPLPVPPPSAKPGPKPGPEPRSRPSPADSGNGLGGRAFPSLKPPRRASRTGYCSRSAFIYL